MLDQFFSQNIKNRVLVSHPREEIFGKCTRAANSEIGVNPFSELRIHPYASTQPTSRTGKVHFYKGVSGNMHIENKSTLETSWVND